MRSWWIARWALIVAVSAVAPVWADAESVVTPPEALVAAAKAQILQITLAELAVLGPQEVIIVDVREPYEFDDDAIPGAVNIPRGRLEFDILEHPRLAKLGQADPAALADAEIVLYCRTGGRGALAAQSLQSMGFRHVRSLEGGVKAWKEAGHPVE